jgi:hypothetical protein
VEVRVLSWAPTAKTAFDIAAVFDEKVPPQKNQIRTPSLLPWGRSAVVPFPFAFAEPDVARWSRNVRERPTSDLMVLGFAVLGVAPIEGATGGPRSVAPRASHLVATDAERMQST